MTENNPSVQTITQGWGMNFTAAICERCDSAFIVPNTGGSESGAPDGLGRCPQCFEVPLTALPIDADNPRYTHSPELAAPFDLPDAALDAALQHFAGGIPYPPLDLNPASLRSRARRVYLPVWLVDAQTRAIWHAEAGFDYEVVSHQEQYNGGGWSTRQVKETRVRWEPRLGRLERLYANIPAPALENLRLGAQSGKLDASAARPYLPSALAGTIVLAPDRSPQDAWSDARSAVQAAAAEECRQAAAADHIRQFTWQPEFISQNWTLLLQPVISTYYLDDENTPQPVRIDAHTGQLRGKRRASQKRAARTAGIWLAAAAVIFLISLALAAASLMLPAILAVSVLGFTGSVLAGLCAIIPLFRVWTFNRSPAAS